MDPLTAGLGIVGLGMQLFGGISAAGEAKKQAQISQQNFQLETQVNAQRRQAMELSASRQKLENYRNTQRVRAAGMSAAVSQGAQTGTGVIGGQSQATSQGLFNDIGINQNLAIGRNIFGLNDQISANKSQISQSQSAQATDQGWATFGGALTKNAGTLSSIASYGQTQFNNFSSNAFSSQGFTTGGVPSNNLLTGGIGSA